MMVIAATERLARVRRQEYDWKQQEKGLHTWPSALVMTLDTWLSELWEEGIYSASQEKFLRPLRRAEELIIWEDIMSSHSKYRPLDISATAELASTSWKLLCDWRLPLVGAEWTMSEDSRAFQVWALEFRARCERNRWFSAVELPEQVSNLVYSRYLDVPDEVELIGFLEPTPAQKHFFETLQRHGTRIRETSLPSLKKQIFRLCATDSQREIRIAAEWARAILQSDPEAEDISFEIGVVVPGMRRLRSQIERIFSEVFHPRSGLHPERDPKRLFNISLGLSAAEYPIIHSALQILSIDVRKIPVEMAGQLLLSPFLPGFSEEHISRALLDVELRKRGEQYVTLSDISYFAREKNAPFYCPVLATLIHAWQISFENLNGKKLPSAWAESFSQLLQSGNRSKEESDSEILRSVGWPGDFHTGSIEYQTCGVWEELLSELVELDGVSGKVTRQRAVTLLNRMASNKIFQPESEPAPVQIMGPLEASGLSFNYLWMLGMHDDAWPAPCEPAPFVPILLQRRHGLWRSTPEGMLQNARMLGDRLLNSAPMVVISSPEREGDTDKRISPLFADIPEVSMEGLGIKVIQSLGELIQRSSSLDILEDHYGNPCKDIRYRGGTELFKLQAACPFRAFAELRLGATAPPLPTPGLDAFGRGRMVHRVLDEIWERLNTQSELLSMSREDEAVLVRTIVQELLEKEMSYRRALRNEQYMHVEQNRLERIILEWLDLERKRQPFTVSGREEQKRVIVGGMEIDIREDRVDILEDGQKIILDYKTGECKPSSWDGDRPDDPQLPIYAVAENSSVAGIFFGSLKVGRVEFKGITSKEGTIPGVNPSKRHLPDVIRQWNETLNQLGQEYKAGYAIVSPKDPSGTCKYCKLASFCRVGDSAKITQSRG
ncbi:MAG: PD-(D/E)XK nuclease family protein [Bacteroidetes bacterium]|nr:PD-(D/E)XK nuclease family protein [Bacteroidota bacterium]MCY4204276.1 PD-(D/E)XK nuclease family protein [Bacteroidota bacterium]